MTTAARLTALFAAAFLTSHAAAQATTNPAPTASTPSATPPAQAQPGWWNDAVFYEVFVRSFYDSRTGPLANDGIGDLQGLIEKLDYLNDGNPATDTDLGITALWLMPISPAPSYHGYDVTDYRDVEPRYGTRDDFTRLITEAHKRGIRIIIDLVLNHCSDKHRWFIEAQDPQSPNHDWFIWADKPTDYKGPWGEQIWHRLNSAGRKPVYYYGMFSGSMPDLNYRNPEVTAAARETVRFWLEDLHADGFRLDAIRHLIEDGPVQENTPETHDWLRGFYKHYKHLSPDAFTIGEVWATPAIEASYVGDQLDSTFDFELAQSLVDSVRKGDARALADSLRKNAQAFPLNQFGSFLTNHDQARIMTELLKATRGDRQAADAKAILAARLLMLMPGIPFMYYGEEIGMVGDKPDPHIRTPMQWSAGQAAGFSDTTPWMPPNPDATKLNVSTQERDPASLLSTYKRMIRFRQEQPALRRGTLELVSTSANEVLAFLRATTDGPPLLIVANLSDHPVSNYNLTLPTSCANLTDCKDLLESKQLPPLRVDAAACKPVTELAPREILVMRLAPKSP